MQIVNRIKLPKSAEVSSLYAQCNAGASLTYSEGDQAAYLQQGGTLSSSSYFNSFYEKFYAKYTNLDAIYYLLKLQGDFQVLVYRELAETETRTLIYEEKFQTCQLTAPVKVVLPNLSQSQSPGRIYFELVCCSEQGLFTGGVIATEQEKNREVSLGIVTCTFKKEIYVKNTVNTILQDESLQDKEFKVFVVDNGRTLAAEDFSDARVQLIPNRNVGGSGGFTRGLIEARQENTYSHFLCMDDDIELDSESIYRLFSLYEYAKSDFAVAGSMLDLYKKHVLYEAGALHGRSPNDTKFNLFLCASLKHKLDLQTATSLNLLLVEERIDYGAFWFFSFSKKIIEEIGLPMPIFIKIDDVEFGLRIKERFGNIIVAFPSIAVWHEPFYAKYPIWDVYYIYRNHLITHATHDSLEYINAVKFITKELIYSLLFFEYNYAEMIVKGFEDYVKGPDFLKSADPEILHSNIIKLSKSYKTQRSAEVSSGGALSQAQNLQHNYSPNNQIYQESRDINLKKIISLLTINGHLLPNFLISNDDVFVWLAPDYPGQRYKAFAKKRVSIFREKVACLYQNELDKSAGFNLLTRWFKLAARSSIRWSAISTEWKNASKELTSISFWQKYLGIQKTELQEECIEIDTNKLSSIKVGKN